MKESGKRYSMSVLSSLFYVVQLCFVVYFYYSLRAMQDQYNLLLDKVMASTNANRLLLETLKMQQGQHPVIQSQNSAPVAALRSMEEIGSQTRTDKIEHRYHLFYPDWLEKYRTKNINLLEIGFLHGSSFKMWLEYFPKGNIFFMDKDDSVESRSFPASKFRGSQAKVSDLSRLLQEKGVEKNLDIIVDDGSHHPEHQMISFTYLFLNGLKPGGLYIIEDVEINYWVHGEVYDMPTFFGKDHPDSIMTKLKALGDVVSCVSLLFFSLPYDW
jgi:hypothetical protein